MQNGVLQGAIPWLLDEDQDMASSQPATTFDLAFFRNTGLALVFATLVAGALTLFLTVGESRSIILAQKAQMKEPSKIVTVEISGSMQTASQE